MDISRLGLKDNNSRSVGFGDLIFLSGITADDKSADMAGQTGQVLAKIDKHLADVGTNKSRLLAATVYLSDMTKKEEMNRVWIDWIDPRNPPTRAAVGVTLTPQTMVEIVVIAAR
jgi:enamine deaminase RidA (YjgF/YER057c/UK114 family)